MQTYDDKGSSDQIMRVNTYQSQSPFIGKVLLKKTSSSNSINEDEDTLENKNIDHFELGSKK